MNNDSARSGVRLSARAIVAIASCIFGLGLIIFGFGAKANSTNKDAPAERNAVAQAQKKPVRAWNMALGNVVLVAQELGFGVKISTDHGAEQSKIASRIESQLQRLREIYREESEKNPSLMGGMTLQFNINPEGEVSQVKEIGSRITDTEFKKTIIGEVAKWSFQDVVTDSVTVNCPLLFVREGMDITTLLQWEKSLGQLGDKSALEKINSQPNQQRKAAETQRQAGIKPAAVVSGKSVITTAGKAAPGYQVKYATPLRKEPNFSATIVGKLTVGAKVSVLGRRGEWLEVRAYESQLTGYVRQEFVTPIELAQKQ
jgi:SH3 domain-containing protein